MTTYIGSLLCKFLVSYTFLTFVKKLSLFSLTASRSSFFHFFSFYVISSFISSFLTTKQCRTNHSSSNFILPLVFYVSCRQFSKLLQAHIHLHFCNLVACFFQFLVGFFAIYMQAFCNVIGCFLQFRCTHFAILGYFLNYYCAFCRHYRSNFAI